ncbi:DNA polymerase III subunit beta [Rubinisphaera margarita]|uniref:DNA polymerase III subunit beta n=1 Tax=Rubinisphaera margarita TaxID=2909586 RepID=UPI001EE89C7D|nr:DNA polymerase III subunit beta [Rubinisphaera margarita]MCG6157423.1 DNA polymerase III subunit beta [Rubinisphaera margarita]
MQLKFKRDVLAGALQTVAGVVPSRTPKDILKNTKLVIESGSAMLMATDLEIGMRYQIPEVETGSTGEVLLPTARLMQILREVTVDEIVLNVNEDLLEVQAGQSEFRLPVEDPREFPDVAPFSAEACYAISGQALRQAIRRVIFAADDESTRYALGGIFVEMAPTQMVLAATDSRRLAVMEAVSGTQGEVSETRSIVVPRKAMTLIERSIEGDDAEILLAPGDNEITVRSGNCMIYSRLVEGRFPNFRDVLPSDVPISVDLVAGPFHNLVRQSQIVTSDESRGVDFVFTPGTVTLKSQAADVGQSKVEMPIDYDGDELAIMFDPRFVAEFLRVLEPETTIQLGLIGGEDPAVFRCEEEYKYVIMPLARDA